ncbi:MAG TPA: trypsin-like peptidase domain-containing protein [Bryobacteraceae bacterium]|nr:trypsin-like peptidase domain-containing protein [Bryobacteraceae bacterium]
MRANNLNRRGLILLGAVSLAPLVRAQTPTRGLQSLDDLSASLQALAAKVRPAVVQIFSTGYAAPQESGGTAASSLLSAQRSTGTGVILAADGYIVTNNHVVQGARRIEVRLPAASRAEARESTLPAKLVGADRESDLAVLKIDRTGLPFLALGDSNDLNQGQVVMAFGNPLGLEGSVSMGIVSSTARRLQPDDPMVYVQTDAPINPGNSGGPLVDTSGNVVGINTFILTQSGGSEGLGFAIPSNAVRNTYEQIRKDGHVHRGQIGVVVQSITKMLATGLNLPQDWGVIAADVIPGGPADKAGLKLGDIILSANGRTMEDAPQLETVIRRSKLAEQVHLTVLREGQNLDYDISVSEREDDPQRFADMVNPDDNLIEKLGILGIEINDKISAMLPDLRHDYGIVVAARSASPPYSGPALDVGDVIYQIGGTPTVTVKALRDKFEGMKPGDAAVLQIERSGTLQYITVEFE